MQQKEFEAYRKLVDLCVFLMNTTFRDSKSKHIRALLQLTELIDKYQNPTSFNKGLELENAGLTLKTVIKFKKSVKQEKNLPSQAPLGTCIYVEDLARYFIKGKSKWIETPAAYIDLVQSNKNRFPEWLLGDI